MTIEATVMVCSNCDALAHYWEKQETEVAELGETKYELLAWRCVCTCECPAVLATVRSEPIEP